LQDALLLDHSLVAPALLLLSQFPLDVRNCLKGMTDRHSDAVDVA